MSIRNAKQEEMRRLESKTLNAQFKTAVQEGLNCSPFESEAVLGVVREVYLSFWEPSAKRTSNMPAPVFDGLGHGTYRVGISIKSRLIDRADHQHAFANVGLSKRNFILTGCSTADKFGPFPGCRPEQITVEPPIFGATSLV